MREPTYFLNHFILCKYHSCFYREWNTSCLNQCPASLPHGRERHNVTVCRVGILYRQFHFLTRTKNRILLQFLKDVSKCILCFSSVLKLYLNNCLSPPIISYLYIFQVIVNIILTLVVASSKLPVCSNLGLKRAWLVNRHCASTPSLPDWDYLGFSVWLIMLRT